MSDALGQQEREINSLQQQLAYKIECANAATRSPHKPKYPGNNNNNGAIYGMDRRELEVTVDRPSQVERRSSDVEVPVVASVQQGEAVQPVQLGEVTAQLVQQEDVEWQVLRDKCASLELELCQNEVRTVTREK